MKLRTGITTGTCAAAAAKAAVMVLAGQTPPERVAVRLPGGATVEVPIIEAALLRPPLPDHFVVPGEGRGEGNCKKFQFIEQGVAPAPLTRNPSPRWRWEQSCATATVRKDAGDDPDVTDGLLIRARVAWQDSAGVSLAAGEGVGIVTKPGLQVPPGEPAINPAPRRMIAAAIGEVTPRGVHVELSIPGGREVAARTFNPRLGIEGGLSILGTSGIVRPYCTRALHDALKCALDVAAACQVMALVCVPGAIGLKAAQSRFALRDEQVIEVGNDWGFVLDRVPGYRFGALLLLGHAGKLAKLAAGQWDTHSARSGRAVDVVNTLCESLLGRSVPESPTTEGIFGALSPTDAKRLADVLASVVRQAVEKRLGETMSVAVMLVNMAGEPLGSDGDFAPWA